MGQSVYDKSCTGRRDKQELSLQKGSPHGDPFFPFGRAVFLGILVVSQKLFRAFMKLEIGSTCAGKL